MKAIAFLAVLGVGCGGSKPKAAEEPVSEVKREAPETKEEAEPPPPSEPAVAKSVSAKAALEPVKGAKQPPGTVTFTQSAGATSVTSDFTGLKNGTYHLVIHDGTECGPNATKAGAPWKGAEAVKLVFKVGGDEPGNLDENGVALSLDGVAPIIGQTLVLHDDKKRAPGKTLACGTIDAVGQ